MDQATHVKILRDVVLSAEADRSTIRLLQGGDAQLLVDFCQEVLYLLLLCIRHTECPLFPASGPRNPYVAPWPRL